MRKTLSLLLYMLLVDVVAISLVVVPVYAFEVSSSTTGYVRTLNASGASAMFAASRPAQLSAVAAAASAGGSSLAIRIVAGLGWAGLGVAAGLLLYQLFYTPTELAAVKAGATAPPTYTVPALPAGTTITSVAPCPGGPNCIGGYDQSMETFGQNGCATPPGWAYAGGHFTVFPAAVCYWLHPVGNPGTLAVAVPGPVPTAQDINNWLATLPSNDPLSITSHTAVAGVGAQSQPADQVINQPVPASDVTTQVVPATSVGPTDVVVNKDATAPAGPVPTQTATQTSTSTNTTTTTIVTNPDGSTTTTSTTTETEEAPVSACNTGNHELRTFGGILQDHMDLWKGSGLLSALNLLKTLTWPTAIPTYSLQSNLLGNFTLDFSAWSGMLTAIRSIIIAIAGFVAYRLIFVGAR